MMIRDWRLKRGLSLARLAQMVGVANATVVRRWETGECLPRRAQIQKLIEISGGEIDYADFYRQGPWITRRGLAKEAAA